MREGELITRFTITMVLIFLTVTLAISIPSLSQAENAIPKELELRLASEVVNNTRVAVLQFSAVAAANITDGKASNLKLYQKKRGSILSIDVAGYDFIPHRYKADEGVLPAVLFSEGRVVIDTDWLNNTDKKQILVSISGTTHIFNVSYHNCTMTIEKVSSVGLIKLKNKRPPFEDSHSLSIVLWPLDIAVLYVAGRFYPEREGDLRFDLKLFAKKQGYLPAEDAYSGLPQPEKMMLYIAVKDGPKPENSVAKFLGSLSGHPGVDVYLRSVISGLD